MRNYVIPPDGPLTNGSVYYIYTQNDEIRTTATHFNVPYQRVYNLVKKIKPLKRHVAQNIQRLGEIMNSPFPVDICKTPMPSSIPISNPSESDSDSSSQHSPMAQLKDQPCRKCLKRVSIHRKTIKNLEKTISKLKEFNRNHKRKISALMRANEKSVRQHRQSQSVISGLRKKKREIKKDNKRLIRTLEWNKRRESRLKIMAKESYNIKKQKTYHVKKNKSLREDYEKDMETLEAKCIDFKTRISQLEFNLKSSSSDDSPVKEPSRFPLNIRKAIYSSCILNVSTPNLGLVVNSVLKCCTGKGLQRIPSRATTEHMVRELSVIADIQCCEAILNTSSCTLAWDATSIHGDHINEIHINTLEKRTFLLSVAQLPTGETSSYHWHIYNTLKDLAQTYASFYNESFVSILQNIYSTITCTMTDRAAVNSSTVRLLNNELGRNLHLNCNVHPLDSMSMEVRKHLKKSSTSSKSFGSDAAIANVLYGISKLRYKAKGSYLNVVFFHTDNHSFRMTYFLFLM